MTTNERIKYLRKNILNISQAEFAHMIGMKQTSVSTLEKTATTITNQTIKILCLAFNLSEDWLLHGNEPIFTNSKGREHLMFKANLKKLLIERNIRPSALATGTGIPVSTIDSILKTVNEKNIKIDNVIKIADFFGVSVEWLYGKNEIGQKNEEIELLRLFNELNEEGKKNLLGLLNDIVVGGRYKKLV